METAKFDPQTLTTIIQGVITVWGVLIAAIAAMALYIVHLHKTYSKEQKENLSSILNTTAASTKAVENNSNISIEIKTLLHSMNTRMLEGRSVGRRG